MKQQVSLTLNGSEFELECNTSDTLMQVLRKDAQLTGAKDGCSSGDCGACSVIVNGSLMCSCLVLAVECQHAHVETIEGLADVNATDIDALHPLQQTFLQQAALQCGFCTPGLIMAAKSLLENNPDPSEEEVRQYIAGNLCRCTGYDTIVRAIVDAAKQLQASAGSANK